MIESDKYRRQMWFPVVSSFVCMYVKHLHYKEPEHHSNSLAKVVLPISHDRSDNRHVHNWITAAAQFLFVNSINFRKWFVNYNSNKQKISA